MTTTPIAASPVPARVVLFEVASSDLLVPALTERLTAACREAEDSGEPVVIHLRGGRGEPGGAPWPGSSADVTAVSRWERAVRRLERLPVPTVAVADGGCWGPAAELLLAADYRLAAADLTLRLSPAGRQSWPGMALYRLASQAGAGPARRAALLGAGLRADEALGCGLVDEIFESAEAACAELPRLVATLSRLPGPELAIRRRLVSDAASLTFDDALGAHLTACDRTLRRAAAPREHDQILAQI